MTGANGNPTYARQLLGETGDEGAGANETAAIEYEEEARRQVAAQIEDAMDDIVSAEKAEVADETSAVADEARDEETADADVSTAAADGGRIAARTDPVTLSTVYHLAQTQ